MSTSEIDLGRERTESRFNREQYLAGKTTAEVVKALKRRSPKSRMAKKPAQVSRYRSDLRRRGAKV